MSRDIWVNRCRAKMKSRYLLTQAVVLRWEQLLRGARPRVATDYPKQMQTPLQELATGAVTLDAEALQVDLVGTPYDPPRPEPDADLLDELEFASAPLAPQTPATPTKADDAA
jgi:hypothetical protein